MFEIAGHVTVSCWTTVQADSKEKASAIAQDRGMAGFSIDSTYLVDETWHFDNDGSSFSISLDENEVPGLFSVSGLATFSCWTQVLATTESEAISIAKTRDLAGFHIDTNFSVGNTWHFDNDGSPTDISVE
jgi:hypothetical protein